MLLEEKIKSVLNDYNEQDADLLVEEIDELLTEDISCENREKLAILRVQLSSIKTINKMKNYKKISKKLESFYDE